MCCGYDQISWEPCHGFIFILFSISCAFVRQMTYPPPLFSLSLSLRSIKSMQYGRGMIPNPPFPPSSWAASYSLLNRRVPRQLWKNGLKIRDFATLLACTPASSDSSITFKWPIVDRFVHVTVPYICIMHMALRLHLQKYRSAKKVFAAAAAFRFVS